MLYHELEQLNGDDVVIVCRTKNELLLARVSLRVRLKSSRKRSCSLGHESGQVPHKRAGLFSS
jgi:hypothetical protein